MNELNKKKAVFPPTISDIKTGNEQIDPVMVTLFQAVWDGKTGMK